MEKLQRENVRREFGGVRADKVVDARGILCPGPLIELVKAVKESKVGEVVALYSSDKGSRYDIPTWVEKAGHQLIQVIEEDGYTVFLVKRLR